MKFQGYSEIDLQLSARVTQSGYASAPTGLASFQLILGL